MDTVHSVDLGHQRTVKPEEHAKFAQLHSLVPYLVSAKTKDGLMPAFTQMAYEGEGGMEVRMFMRSCSCMSNCDSGHCLGMDLKKADIDAPNVSRSVMQCMMTGTLTNTRALNT